MIVSQSDGVDGKTGELFDQVDKGLEVLFDGNVESISVLEVDGNCGELDNSADFDVIYH